jgi:hypothetical protein
MAQEIIDTEHLLLDAVNVLLQTINQLPIEIEADFDIIVEARMARDTIFEIKRAVLSERWDFNRDNNYRLARDTQGMIPLSSNVLDVSGVGGDLIMRDWKLYSKRSQSFIFEDDQIVDIVWDMPFNSLSHSLRHYITIRAARVFVARTIGDNQAMTYTLADEEDAYLAARRSESRTGRYNIFNSGYGLNNRVRIN